MEKKVKSLGQKFRESVIPGGYLAVNVVDNDLEFALKLFKKKVRDNGVLTEYFERQSYVKPSVIKRRKREIAAQLQKRQSEMER